MLFSRRDAPTLAATVAESVLLISSEPSALERLRAALLPSGHRLLTARSVAEALELEGDGAAAVVDVGLLGPHTADALRSSSGGALLITHEREQRRQAEAVRRPGDVLLERPLSPDALLGCVESLLAAHAADLSAAQPFADLLDEVTGQRPGLQPRVMPTVRDARLAAKMARALESAGLRLGPRHVEACLHACRVLVDEELGRRAAEGSAASGDLAAVTGAEALRLAASLDTLTTCRLEQGSWWLEVFVRGESVLGVRGAESSPAEAEKMLLDALRWTRGRFSLGPSKELPPDVLRFEPARLLPGLLLEGARRLDEARRARA